MPRKEKSKFECKEKKFSLLLKREVCGRFWLENATFTKVSFFDTCSKMQIIPIKNLTSLFPLTFLSKHISLYALGRLKWILDIIWPLNQHFNLKNQRNWIKQVLMIKFWSGINCILLHWPKKLTLLTNLLSQQKS